MVTPEILDLYEPTIGMEVHVQLNTKSKLFAGDDNDARDVAANTLVSPITFGLPGVLPVLNQGAITLAVRAGLALNAKVALTSVFDRKHYFYPDLPKGYQISQFAQPIVGKGSLTIPLENTTFTVGVTRAHLEEDAGKLTHQEGKDYSLVDLNRAGTPLLEIVSDPDIHSPQQARAYAQELYLLMKYADVSDVDLFQGNMRFDVNISVAKKDAETLGPRAEVKNLNSFRSVEKAAEYEFRRQVELMEKGQSVVQETRGWDDAKMKTFSQRSKEDAHDYRYFPDPDLPPVVLTQKEVDTIAEELPVLPSEYRTLFGELSLSPAEVSVLINEPEYSKTIKALLDGSGSDVAQKIARLIVHQKKQSTETAVVELSSNENVRYLATLADMIAKHEISSNGADAIISEFLASPRDPRIIAEEKSLLQNSDTRELEALVDEVIEANKKAAQDVRDGELKAIGFLVGQVMKVSKGQANPQVVQKLLRTKLSQHS